MNLLPAPRRNDLPTSSQNVTWKKIKQLKIGKPWVEEIPTSEMTFSKKYSIIRKWNGYDVKSGIKEPSCPKNTELQVHWTCDGYISFECQIKQAGDPLTFFIWRLLHLWKGCHHK